MRPGALEQRIKDQIESLENAARFVKPGGRLVYVTCSLLKAENEDRVTAFLESRADFLPVEAAFWARACGLEALAGQSSKLGAGIRLSPLRTATDGFYVAALTRTA
jgi:16S rRNA (cytosine967-C5)-methyltransferase